jgi:hypothetical protein
MSSIKKRIATGAVVLALGGLGGVAWASNPAAQHATPAPIAATHSAGSATSPVSTGTSGAAATPVANTQPLPSIVSNGGRRDD